MDNRIFIDCQGIGLNEGQEANADLYYNPKTDLYELEVDCWYWADGYRDFMKEYYPDDDPEERISDAESWCKSLSGKYSTISDVNDALSEYCNDGDWYRFNWQDDDGNYVE